MLIEGLLPIYDVREHHAIVLRADPRRAYRAVTEVDLSRSLVIRMLFGLRGLPSTRPLTLLDLTKLGFVVLDEDDGNEIVLGLIGRFWLVRGGLRRLDPGEFACFSEPGYAKAVWNFRVEASGPDRSTVSTETRVLATDPGSRQRFLRYWRLIRPFSATIRRRVLGLIRKAAER